MAGLTSLVALIAMVEIAIAQEWRIEEVAEGTKPELAVDQLGRPRIAFMTEARQGGVFYAVRGTDGWEIEAVATGYFYGPLDLALDAEGHAHIAYHDHQAPDFNPQLGDATYVFQDGDDWVVETIGHPGHDGWDTSIAVSPSGEVHVASIDPVQFGSLEGVEWAVRGAGGGWSVEAIGSGPVPYEFGTGLVLNREGVPSIAYHDGSERLSPGADGSDLYLAVRNGGSWSLEVVDQGGDVGKFASLALDSQDREHIAYFHWIETGAGIVKYAVRDDGDWSIEEVDELNSVQISFLGARRMVAIAVDGDDRPHIAYADQEKLSYARRNGTDWDIAQVAQPVEDGAVLGQLVSLALEATGRPHIAYYELAASAPSSTGTVYYAVGSAPTSVSETANLPTGFHLAPNAPNPFNPSTEIGFSISTPGQVQLAVYNLLGQEVRLLHSGWLEPGAHRTTWDGTDAEGNEMASGVYLAFVRAGSQQQVRKMLLLR